MRRAVMLSLSVIIASFLGLAWQAHACLTDQGLLLVTDERLASVVGGLACFSQAWDDNFCYNNAAYCQANGSDSWRIDYYPGVVKSWCQSNEASNSGDSSGSLQCNGTSPQNCYVKVVCTGSTDW